MKSRGGDRPETFTTGDMARLSNNTLRTVRFYEEAGVLTPLGRTEGGHRVFDRSQLDRLMWISDMREAGMSLDEIKALLDVKLSASSGGAAAVAAIDALKGHREALRAKIDILHRLCEDIDKTVEAASGCLSCQDAALFPHQCGDCGRLLPNRPLSRGMRVLWGVEETPPNQER